MAYIRPRASLLSTNGVAWRRVLIPLCPIKRAVMAFECEACGAGEEHHSQAFEVLEYGGVRAISRELLRCEVCRRIEAVPLDVPGLEPPWWAAQVVAGEWGEAR